jgi:hypothetical protein
MGKEGERIVPPSLPYVCNQPKSVITKIFGGSRRDCSDYLSLQLGFPMSVVTLPYKRCVIGAGILIHSIQFRVLRLFRTSTLPEGYPLLVVGFVPTRSACQLPIIHCSASFAEPGYLRRLTLIRGWTSYENSFMSINPSNVHTVVMPVSLGLGCG